jgi:hypothetical protein
MYFTRRSMLGLLSAGSLNAAALAEKLLENVPVSGGEAYEAEVPDTLDLAERCRLGLQWDRGAD